MNLGARIRGMNPKSKKALKEAFDEDPNKVKVYATSLFDDGFEGPITELPPGRHVIVGPNPYDNRKWYAQVSVPPSGGKVVIK